MHHHVTTFEGVWLRCLAGWIWSLPRCTSTPEKNTTFFLPFFFLPQYFILEGWWLKVYGFFLLCFRRIGQWKNIPDIHGVKQIVMIVHITDFETKSFVFGKRNRFSISLILLNWISSEYNKSRLVWTLVINHFLSEVSQLTSLTSFLIVMQLNLSTFPLCVPGRLDIQQVFERPDERSENRFVIFFDRSDGHIFFFS